MDNYGTRHTQGGRDRRQSTELVNKFLVSRNCTGNAVIIMRPPRELISKADALLLAALLVDAADDTSDLSAFRSMYAYVKATMPEGAPAR